MFEWDNEGWLMPFMESIHKAPKGTLAYEMKPYWIEFAVSYNIDKLYESPW